MLHQDPKFGYDGWPNPATATTVLAPVQRTYAGEDAYTAFIGALTPGLSMYASYVDNLGGWDDLVKRFGKAGAFLLSITIFGNRARCADVESGAMNVSDLPRWLAADAISDALSPPWVYTSASNMGNVNTTVSSHKIVRFSAHYGHGEHVCGPATCGYPQADWTQWDDKGPQGQNVDRSTGIWIPSTVTPPSPVKHVDPHYDWYEDTVFTIDGHALNERRTVQSYDGARKHPLRYHRLLTSLEADCQLLADRIASLVLNGDGAWNEFHRGFRYQGLIHRAQGKEIV